MATSSITKNFVISGQKQVEMFATLAENASNLTYKDVFMLKLPLSL